MMTLSACNSTTKQTVGTGSWNHRGSGYMLTFRKLESQGFWMVLRFRKLESQEGLSGAEVQEAGITGVLGVCSGTQEGLGGAQVHRRDRVVLRFRKLESQGLWVVLGVEMKSAYD